MKATITFGNGQTFCCIGRVGSDGKTIPFKDGADVLAHIARVNIKSGAENLKLAALSTPSRGGR